MIDATVQCDIDVKNKEDSLDENIDVVMRSRTSSIKSNKATTIKRCENIMEVLEEVCFEENVNVDNDGQLPGDVQFVSRCFEGNSPLRFPSRRRSSLSRVFSSIRERKQRRSNQPLKERQEFEVENGKIEPIGSSNQLTSDAAEDGVDCNDDQSLLHTTQAEGGVPTENYEIFSENEICHDMNKEQVADISTDSEQNTLLSDKTAISVGRPTMPDDIMEDEGDQFVPESFLNEPRARRRSITERLRRIVRRQSSKPKFKDLPDEEVSLKEANSLRSGVRRRSISNLTSNTRLPSNSFPTRTLSNNEDRFDEVPLSLHNNSIMRKRECNTRSSNSDEIVNGELSNVRAFDSHHLANIERRLDMDEWARDFLKN